MALIGLELLGSGSVTLPALTTSAVAQTAPAGRAIDSAEQQLWDSVKESKNVADLQSYLARYPAGTFAAMARLRILAIGGGVGAESPASTALTTKDIPLPAAPGPDSILTSPQVIAEAHELLYNLNYSPGAFEGKITPRLRRAIQQWQEVAHRPVTGDLNQEAFERLKRARAPKIWGVIAYSWTGATGAVWTRSNRAEAENEAQNTCRASAQRTCTLLTFTGTRCGVVVHALGASGAQGQAYGIWDSDLATARTRTMELCRRQAKSPEKCTERIAACADGSHTR